MSHKTGSNPLVCVTVPQKGVGITEGQTGHLILTEKMEKAL